MAHYDWNFRFLWPYAPAFARGVGITLSISVVSFVVGTLLGTAMGVALRAIPFRRTALLANDALRSIPLLVLLFFFYYLPYRRLFGIDPPGAFWCTILAMSLSQAAFTADLVRAAIDGVSTRPILGARALGLREGTIWWSIILPDIIRQTLAPQIAFFIGIVKLTSLASVIGCEEVVFVARVAVSQNFRSLEAWAVVAMIYVALIVPLTVAARSIEGGAWLKRRA